MFRNRFYSLHQMSRGILSAFYKVFRMLFGNHQGMALLHPLQDPERPGYIRPRKSL